MRNAAPMLVACLTAAFSLFPRAVCGQEETTIADVHVTRDVVYGHKFGMALTLDVLQPPKPNGCGVAFLVSGGWVSRWMPARIEIAYLRPLLKRGFTVFAVRHGSSPKFTVPEAVEDVRRAVRFLRMTAARWKVDPDRLGASGFSAGGHLAVMLATTGDDGDPKAKDPVLRQSSRVAAAVAYFPPTDLRPYVKPTSPYRRRFPALAFDPDKAPAVSPLLQVTPDDAPVLLVHGKKDTLVPHWHSEKLADAYRHHKLPVRLILFDNAGHGFAGTDAQEAREAWVAWLEKHLLHATNRRRDSGEQAKVEDHAKAEPAKENTQE